VIALLKRLFFSLLALLLIFEEWLWNLLTALGQQLSRWLHLERIEAWLQQAPPKLALLAFIVPLLIVTPINLASIWLLSKGMLLQGLALQLAAKLLATLLVARVFRLTKPQLLTFTWFARCYHFVVRWVRWAHHRVTETQLYQMLLVLKQQFKDWKQRLIEWFN
jgi:hypothetical protein